MEVASPWQLLELKQAAFALLRRAVHQARQAMPGLVLMANNHDYLEGSYWGCHENYAIACHPQELAHGMLPFLATRLLFAGNGRLDPQGRVLLSSRAPAMERITGGETMRSRALYSTCRDEPLMDRGPFSHRLHLICGDTLAGQCGEFLKVGTTALVLAWLQHDPRGADDLLHRFCPLRLLRASNVFWRPTQGLRLSRTALKIQRNYCERVGRFVERSPGLPDWCHQVVALWDQTLDLLRNDPMALTDRLDPFIKLTLFDAVLNELGRDWSEIASDQALYHRLALIDLAYHEVGDLGPFQQLDQQGRLNHRLVPVPVEATTATDVAQRLTTRTAPRAAVIAALSGQADVLCGWTGIERMNPRDRIDLSHPLRTETPVLQAGGERTSSPGSAGPYPSIPGRVREQAPILERDSDQTSSRGSRLVAPLV